MTQPANDDFSQHLSDDEALYHEDASDNCTATNKPKQQQQQLIPTTTTILNIKLPILKKEEYDIWAMEMEHYLEYIDNDVWNVIQNGNSKKRISTGKDGDVRVLPPVSAAEIHAVEKERKARTILLMAIPKDHLRRFHGMDDANEIWEAIRTRFSGNANSKKMQKAVLKQQFEAFTISSSERSLPPAWSILAMTMKTKPDVDTLSINDLYNNLEVFEQVPQNHLQVLKMLLLSHTARAAITRLSLVILVPTVLTLLLLLQTIFQNEKFLLVLLMRDGHNLAYSNDCFSNEEVLQEDWKESSN
ncbi:hypothetical protein Tco_0661813 [Tanacetum coccineum]